MDEHAIELEGVTKRFRDKVAVRGLDLVVPRGVLMGFLGPNGAGKTTTIRMIMSIFHPDAGRVSVLGRSSASESKDRIGYLPEERGVYRKMRVGQFLMYVGRLKGVARREASRAIDAWLERVRLPEVRRKRCEELSKGMQQKVQFIASVIHEPELVILDEPFSGLDPVNLRLLRELVEELHEGGRTIIFSTHVLAQAEEMCERVVMIDGGRKVIEGTVAEVCERHGPRVVEVALADAVEDTGWAVSIPGVAEAAIGKRGVVELRLDDAADEQAVMRAAMEGRSVRRVESRRASLEDVFIEQIGSSIAEREAEAAREMTATDAVGAGAASGEERGA